MKQRLLNLLIALDQFLFVLVTAGLASPDETLSAAAWRWEKAGKIRGKILRPIIDALFFFDKYHCRRSYEAELFSLQLPLEYANSVGTERQV